MSEGVDRRTVLRGAIAGLGAAALGGLAAACGGSNPSSGASSSTAGSTSSGDASTGGGSSTASVTSSATPKSLMDGGDGQAVTMWSWVASDISKLPSIWEGCGKRWVGAGSGRNFKYVVVDYGQYETKVKSALAAGDPPGLFAVNMNQVGAFASSGQLMDLTDIVKQLPPLNEKMVQRYLVDGKQYVYWPDVNAQGILYNKTIFDKLGLAPPTTMKEFAALADPIRKAGYEPLASAFGPGNAFLFGDVFFQGMAYADPTDTMIPKAEQGAVAWNSPEFVAAAEYMPLLRDSGLLAKGVMSMSGMDVAQMMGTQKVAMMYPGAVWSYGMIDPINNGAWEYGYFEMPPSEAGVAPRSTGGPSTCLVVPSATKTAEGALGVLAAMSDPAGQQSFAENGFIPGVRGTVLPAKLPYPLFPAFVKTQENAATRTILNPKVQAALEDRGTALFNKHAEPKDLVDAMQAASKS